MTQRVGDPHMTGRLMALFAESPFMVDLGVRLVDANVGWCETEMLIESRHLQHSGVVHAGVQASLADNTAGAAGLSVVDVEQFNVLSVEFKINMLRAAQGTRLQCIAEVLKPGRRLTVVEASVWSHDEGRQPVLTSKATVTLICIPRS